jgi:hypothetical protein
MALATEAVADDVQYLLASFAWDMLAAFAWRPPCPRNRMLGVHG